MKKNALVFGFIIIIIVTQLFAYETGEYLSPENLVVDKDGEHLYITAFTANKVVVYHIKNKKIIAEIDFENSPTGLCLSPDENTLYVTTSSEKGVLCIVDLKNKKIKSKIPVGHTANSPILDSSGKILFINNQFDNTVSVIRLNTEELIAEIPVLREPVASILTADGQYLFVANYLPVGPADTYSISSSISVISTEENKVVKNIDLPNGSNAIRGLAISPDSKFVYATHILARYQMPTTQLERGWMNTNALSIIDVMNLKLYNTVLLDEIDLGAANPWDVKCSKNGKYLCISHAGSHEVSVINRDSLHHKLTKVKDGLNIAGRILKPGDVKNDLAFLNGFRRRISLKGLGPRGLILTGDRIFIAEYFSESIGFFDIEDRDAHDVYTIKLGNSDHLSDIRKGELLFHDGRQCFQMWQSCVSCHPGDARADALNWDLLNDGIGNAKNSKSLLLSHKTPPVMISGVRDKAESAVRAGIKYIQFASLPDRDADAIDQYLSSLKPIPSPHLINGELSTSAKRGEKLFISATCIECHSGSLYTDLKQYDVGTGKGREKNMKFDTPTIIENWRTAPYLHDGRAATMREVLTTYNPEDKHGITSNLSDQDIDDLVEYVLSQ
jgi:YVTN family beta-propeller protein